MAGLDVVPRFGKPLGREQVFSMQGVPLTAHCPDAEAQSGTTAVA